MPRPRVSQQVPAPRSRLQLRTSMRSHSDPLPPHGGYSRSSSTVSVPSDSANQRKLGTRITDLESRLGQAQKELKNLKGQLSVKTDARKGLVKRTTTSSQRSLVKEKRVDVEMTERQPGTTTDVFEVPNSSVLKDEEITSLRSKLEERAKELQVARTARETLKAQLCEASTDVSSARDKEEEMGSRLTRAEEELASSRENILHLKKNLDEAEAAKRALEEEMKELSLQTEKWKVAADAAAQVLAEGADKEAMRVSGMRGSIDNNFLSILFETPSSLDSYGKVADDFAREYPRSSGSRTFADLWKWKGLK